jgi:hypothetical protein
MGRPPRRRSTSQRCEAEAAVAAAEVELSRAAVARLRELQAEADSHELEVSAAAQVTDAGCGVFPCCEVDLRHLMHTSLVDAGSCFCASF